MTLGATPHTICTSHEKKMADSGTSVSVRKSSSWILFICGDLKNVLAVQVHNVEVASYL